MRPVLNSLKLRLAVVCWLSTTALPSALASFHFMQIEQVIGGVDGDTTAQAIQLRMRSTFQCFLTGAKLWVRDADGMNPILLIDFQSGVPSCDMGDRVLIASSNFAAHLEAPPSADFTLTNLIPESYLAAGSITYENDAGTLIHWRLSWGGAGYTGDTTGATTNDADGEFGPAWPGPLPADSTFALQFQGPAIALSTTNEEDYALTPVPAFFVNNACEASRLGEPCPWDLPCPPNGAVDVVDLVLLLSAWGPNPNHPADFNGDGIVGIIDLLALLAAWGQCP